MTICISLSLVAVMRAYNRVGPLWNSRVSRVNTKQNVRCQVVNVLRIADEANNLKIEL